MTTSNSALRQARRQLRLSQDQLAVLLRRAGHSAGDTIHPTKRTIQRWEAGQTGAPQPAYARALERVTGLPIELLGFPSDMRVTDDGAGGHDVDSATAAITNRNTEPAQQAAAGGGLTGVWRSRYEYPSSGRDGVFVGLHFVLLVQHGKALTARSLAGSSLALDMTIDGSVVTGTWREQTEADGYYRGAVYHGAIQLLAEPTGRRLAGKWVGFGKGMDINTGPWELVFETASTAKATLERYEREPDADV